MTQNQGLRRLILVAFITVTICAGCAGGPPPAPQAYSSAKNPANSGGYGDDAESGWLFRALTGRGDKASQASQSPAQTSPNAANPAVQPPVQNPGQPQFVSQTSAIEQGPSAGISKSSAVIATVATEPVGEDTSREFPVSILPPQPQITSAPPKVLPEPPPTPASMVDPMKDKDLDFWERMAPENLWKSLKKATGYGPNEKIARATFKEGQDLFIQKKFAEAADKFKTAADRWPDTPFEEDALFMLAESRFFSDQYPKAHDTYALLLKKYNNSRHLDVAVQREFALGRYWEKLNDSKPIMTIQPNVTDKSRPMFDTFGYAVQAYQNVRMYDPTGPLADDSVMASAVAYFRRGQFENAALDFDLLRKEYPNSEHQKAAHILGLQAKMRVYQGMYYDPTALSEAGEIADQTLSQFGAQLGAEQNNVAKARKQIIEEKANRDYAMAQYYEKQKYYGSARLYYQGIIEKFPSTSRAKDAKERLDTIKGEPDVPPNYFKWISDLMPSDRK
jgi:outer membrane protein assembly factor BamD (BamD/ComL family)